MDIMQDVTYQRLQLSVLAICLVVFLDILTS